jgi:hypothetical protein
MITPDDNDLRDALRLAHEHDPPAPSFDEVWEAVAQQSGADDASSARPQRSSGLRIAAFAAAAALVLGGLGLVAMNILGGPSDMPMSTTETVGPTADLQGNTRAPQGADPGAGADPIDEFANYDILDWTPQTDGLLAHDDRILEPPSLGEAAWGDDAWTDLDTDTFEEL